jgi:transcriptional antiterminator NusG
MDKKEEQYATKIFAVKTTTGQEKNVAEMIALRVRTTKLPIKSVLVPEMMKGYVFVESEGPHFVEQAISGVKHVRSRVPGLVTFSEVERYIVTKPVIEELNPNDVVEVVGGPFKGMRAKITRIDKTKEERKTKPIRLQNDESFLLLYPPSPHGASLLYDRATAHDCVYLIYHGHAPMCRL